jgi:hypothetical protein
MVRVRLWASNIVVGLIDSDHPDSSAKIANLDEAVN